MGNKNSRSHRKGQSTNQNKSYKNCKRCPTAVKYDHCCYNTCFENIFNAHSFIDVLHTAWMFTNKHEIELYNALLPVQLESIIPLISDFLPNKENMSDPLDDESDRKAMTPDPEPINEFPPMRMIKERALSVPFYVPSINMSSLSFNTSSEVPVHAFFHGYISFYNRDHPPCFTWMSTLMFDEYDNRNYGKKKTLQITVLGDAGVGKSALVQRYITGEFNENYTPTIFDCYTNPVLLGSNGVYEPVDDTKAIEYGFDPNKMELNILDTAGGDVISMTGSIDEWIENGQVFLLCFDVTRGLTLHFLKSYIIPRIQQHYEEGSKRQDCKYSMDKSTHIGPCGIVLIGCKVDLRGSSSSTNLEDSKQKTNDDMIENYDSAVKLAKEMNIPYIETSAKSGENIEFMFKQCVFEYWIQTQTNCIKWKIE
eukprot:33856_1